MPSIIRATTTSGLQVAPDNSGSLQLQTNGTTTALTIDTSQNVGIGTTSPQNDAGYKTLTVNGTSGGQVSFKTNDANIGSIYSVSTALNLTTGTSIPMVFQTNGSERMRIDSSGNVLFGTTSSVISLADGNASTNGMGYRNNSTGCWLAFQNESAACFYASKKTGYTDARFMQFSVNATGVGSITTNGTTTSYVTTSDYRLKENIVPMTGALDKVAQLKPVTYKWKIDGSDGQGFIAHELQEVVSDCVTGEKDAVETYTDEDGIKQTRIKPQGIDTSFLVATLTAAIQEQQTIINDLKARIETLEAK
jgi:hypothetical protein